MWVDRNSLGNIKSFIDSNHFLSKVEPVVAKRNYKELAVLSLLSDVIANNRHVFVVLGRFDFVHTIKERWLVQMEGKDHTQGAQGLLPAQKL